MTMTCSAGECTGKVLDFRRFKMKRGGGAWYINLTCKLCNGISSYQLTDFDRFDEQQKEQIHDSIAASESPFRNCNMGKRKSTQRTICSGDKLACLTKTIENYQKSKK